jgi:hypothetical protein
MQQTMKVHKYMPVVVVLIIQNLHLVLELNRQSGEANFTVTINHHAFCTDCSSATKRCDKGVESAEFDWDETRTAHEPRYHVSSNPSLPPQQYEIVQG